MTPSRGLGYPSQSLQQVVCGTETGSAVEHTQGGGAKQNTHYILTQMWTRRQSLWSRSAERPKSNRPGRHVQARWTLKSDAWLFKENEWKLDDWGWSGVLSPFWWRHAERLCCPNRFLLLQICHLCGMSEVKSGAARIRNPRSSSIRTKYEKTFTSTQDIWWYGGWNDRHWRWVGVAGSWRTAGVRLPWVWTSRIAPRLPRIQWGIWISGVGCRGLAWMRATIPREAVCWWLRVIPTIEWAPGFIVARRIIWVGHFTCGKKM